MGKIQLSACDRSWDKADEERIYDKMKALGYAGLEITPRRVFPQETYAHVTGVALFAGYLYQNFGLHIAGLTDEMVYPVPDDGEQLEEAMGGLCRFAAACRCETLVLPCPELSQSDSQTERALHACGLLAAQYGNTLALKPRPGQSVRELCRTVKALGIPGLSVCLDVGTLLSCGESVTDLVEYLPQISYVRITEPDMGPIVPHKIHRELALLLHGLGYQGYVSVEMDPTNPEAIEKALEYVAEVFQ